MFNENNKFSHQVSERVIKALHLTDLKLSTPFNLAKVYPWEVKDIDGEVHIAIHKAVEMTCRLDYATTLKDFERHVKRGISRSKESFKFAVNSRGQVGKTALEVAVENIAPKEVFSQIFKYASVGSKLKCSKLALQQAQALKKVLLAKEVGVNRRRLYEVFNNLNHILQALELKPLKYKWTRLEQVNYRCSRQYQSLGLLSVSPFLSTGELREAYLHNGGSTFRAAVIFGPKTSPKPIEKSVETMRERSSRVGASYETLLEYGFPTL